MKRPVFSGYGGTSGLGSWGASFGRLLGMPVVDPEQEVGKLYKSSIPFSCLKWEQRAAAELELVIQRIDENGDWEIDNTHRALGVLRAPNPFHSTKELFDCIRWDYHFSGNAYVLKVRSVAGKVVQLWHIPSWMIDPRWDEGGFSFIDCYEYRVNGQSFAIPTRDIIHFRNGYDPEWQGRKGVSPFAAVCREVMTDDEAAVLVASLLKNQGMPGVIISPESLGDKTPTQWKKEDRAEFREYWDENFTGDNRGRPFMHSIPIKIQFPAYNLQQLALDKIRQIPEQRIAGAFGLPMSVLQLGSGVQNSNSRANKSDDRRQAYESCIIPTSMELAQTLTRGLLAEFGDDIITTRVWFDISNVSCMKADITILVDAMVKACGGPFLSVNEARKQTGHKPVEGGNKVRQPVQNSTETDESKPNDETDAENDTANGETAEAEQN